MTAKFCLFYWVQFTDLADHFRHNSQIAEGKTPLDDDVYNVLFVTISTFRHLYWVKCSKAADEDLVVQYVFITNQNFSKRAN